MSNEKLEAIASERKIKIHEPFAEFLKADPLMTDFEISLLDCYRLAGHACHAITGAFLTTQAAIETLFSDTMVCERGDLMVEFGSELDENATGPRSHVISFITGAWAESGFPGLKGKYNRKGLISYGHSDLEKNAVRFKRISNDECVVIEYDSSPVVNDLKVNLDFPEVWRTEICAILKNPGKTLNIIRAETESSCGTSGPNGCC